MDQTSGMEKAEEVHGGSFPDCLLPAPVPPVPSLNEIKLLPTRDQQYENLVLARQRITKDMARGERGGLCPEIILQRAEVYEALGYSELALADAYVSYTLCEVVLEGGHVSDLEPVTMSGERWPPLIDTTDTTNCNRSSISAVDDTTGDNERENEHEDDEDDDDENEDEAEDDDEDDDDMVLTHDQKTMVLKHKYRSLILLSRAALLLGCQHQSRIWIDELVAVRGTIGETAQATNTQAHVDGDLNGALSAADSTDSMVSDFCNFWSVCHGEVDRFRKAVSDIRRNGDKRAMFGSSQRVVYPWNEREPDRMNKNSLGEINTRLKEIAPGLEVEISVLPNLLTSGTNETENRTTRVTNGDSTTTPPPVEGSSQLGLYAKKDLAPGSTILEERSTITAIRPHGEALCDACAADMETIPHDRRRYCDGCNIPFCSDECHDLAMRNYHSPNVDDEETDEGYPPAETPFCPGSSGNEDIHTLGRAESSTTPEWDLYFLLLSRTMQTAETQAKHPLDLFEIKYLWGDFSPVPGVDDAKSERIGETTPRTLPYSVRHHVELPLQWFEVLMHSRDDCRPYSKHWLEKYDWWIVQTLFAKFRGVADAQQSTWTGKPEVAAVHPLWCLANHSCNPNVTWKSSGVRNLTVVQERVWRNDKEDPTPTETEWTGLKAGEEIWNHYTDVQEKDYRERRARLQGVLGGDCRCERCVAEEARARATS
ncbi:hypothetical protein PV08_06624 [Exophiala spinifera]|uniref:SET domain-containing protein n=1 Tax=Exophiala spinifera TaxID=91928 RepID=A0A0D2BRF5_9EURO|nr:uncharacterized protein PV08_06624 [Exophiala spinifera]KIW13844.1 hypothetical protein PV08_06624 [Exophiala spinifera]